MRLYFISLLLATATYAYRKGGKPEQIAALLFVLAFLASIPATRPWVVRYSGVEYALMTIDVALWLAMFSLALYADRFWPIAMTALLAMTVFSHVAKFFDLTFLARAYQGTLHFWAYLTLPLLALATWRHHRRGPDEPSWSARAFREPTGEPRDER